MKNFIKILCMVLSTGFNQKVLSSNNSTNQNNQYDMIRKAAQSRNERLKSSNPPAKTKAQDKKSFTDNKPMATITSSNHNQNPTTLKQSFNNNSTSGFYKDIALTYVVTMAATTIHEVGHALAIKALYNESQPINLGWFSKSPTLISVPGVNLNLPLLPFVGYVSYRSNGESHVKDIAIALAGPILGALAAYGIYKLLQKIYPKDKDYPYAKSWSKNGIMSNLLNLLPIKPLDGYNVISSFIKWVKS